MTYRELYERLTLGNIENSEWDAACLLSHFCGISLSTVYADTERDYALSGDLENAVARRLAHEPLQYILGEWEFYRQTYEVTPDCLIPRSDTECLVEEAIKLLPHGALFADLCTGSGCIAISTLAERPDTRAYALEKFPATLALAERNAQRNGVRDRFEPICADVLLLPSLPFGSLDAILSNPPYIATREIQALSQEVHAEPYAALDGGEDGLDFYRAILKNWSHLLKKDGFILFEIGYDQGAALTELSHAYGFQSVCIKRDLGGNDRVAILSNFTPTDHNRKDTNH